MTLLERSAIAWLLMIAAANVIEGAFHLTHGWELFFNSILAGGEISLALRLIFSRK